MEQNYQVVSYLYAKWDFIMRRYIIEKESFDTRFFLGADTFWKYWVTLLV